MAAPRTSTVALEEESATPVMEAPRAPEIPLVRSGLRAFLDIDRVDAFWIVGLVALAFALRFLSPIFPDLLTHPFHGVPVTAWGVGYPYDNEPNGCKEVYPHAHSGPERACGFVFDEVYFPVDAAMDLHQPAISYFDPEPPLAKILMTPPIAVLGFNTWAWRLSTTFFGSLFCGLVYLIARRLRRERFFAASAGLFVTLDGLAFVESRTGVIDMIAIFFVTLLYYCFLLHWQARTRRQWRTTLYVMAGVAGLALAAKTTAIAPLVVGLTLILVRWLEPVLRRRIPALRSIVAADHGETMLWREAAHRGAVHLVAAALLVPLVFGVSFSRYLTIEHDDVYRFTSCTPGTDPNKSGVHAPQPSPLPAAFAHVGGVTLPNPVQAVRNVVEITQASLQYHAQECRDHPYASRWYSWPLMIHPVLFYCSGSPCAGTETTGGAPAESTITDMGNPAVWWLSVPALIFCLWRMLLGSPRWRAGVPVLMLVSLLGLIVLFRAAQAPDAVSVRVSPSPLFYLCFAGMICAAVATALAAVLSRRFVPAFILLAYITAWMMWVPGNERRVLFFYHALGMLPFAALALAYVLSAMRGAFLRVRSREISLAPLSYAVVATVVASFVFFYPVWTGAPLPFADHEMRIWTDTW